jgi:hypothetical protein
VSLSSGDLTKASIPEPQPKRESKTAHFFRKALSWLLLLVNTFDFWSVLLGATPIEIAASLADHQFSQVPSQDYQT